MRTTGVMDGRWSCLWRSDEAESQLFIKKRNGIIRFRDYVQKESIMSAVCFVILCSVK